MKQYSSLFFLIIILILTFFMIINPDATVEAALDGLKLWGLVGGSCFTAVFYRCRIAF